LIETNLFSRGIVLSLFEAPPCRDFSEAAATAGEDPMQPGQHRLTLEALLSDPLTQLVMRSDNITPADVEQAFAMAESGLRTASVPPPLPTRRSARGFMRGFCGASRMV